MTSNTLALPIVVLLGLALCSGQASAVTQYSVTDLGTLGGRDSYAWGINTAGQVVGETTTASGYYRAFLWQDGVMHDLGTLGGGHSFGHAINGPGQVTGCSDTVSGASHAFLWTNGVMRDLGTLGGPLSEARAINASKQVVGAACTPYGGVAHAFLWQSGVMRDLGTFGGQGSYAYDINALTQVVGYAQTASVEYRAFLWENGVLYDLNKLIPHSPGWRLSCAGGINDRGRIVGSGSFEGETHAFLLTPIPEPSVVGLVGFAFLFAMRRTRPR